MTAAGLAATMQGAAGVAAQAALTRFEEASTQQTNLLTEISQNVQQGGVQYDTADFDPAKIWPTRCRSDLTTKENGE